MTRPITEYYIASSHNTYLEGDQINGPCSLQVYVRSIQRGCRCVEIDCWDDDDEPTVYHGYCPCKRTRLAFRDVVNECAKYAFEEDKPYAKFPFILSLENHCSISNQKKMADYIKEAFGAKLVTKQLKSGENKMPSPSEIGPCCIVKGKKLKELPISDVADCKNDEYDYVDEEDESAETDHGEKDVSNNTQVDGRDLSDITVYTVSRHLKPFDEEAADDDYKYISSIKEGKGEQIMKEESAQFIKHTNRELARIYQNGSRFQSDNYDPLPFWAHGCQVVALNYQTDCKERLKNQIMFQINGNCGYVRKPSLLSIPNFDPNDKNQVPMKKTTFTIKIISGQQFHNERKNSGKAGDVCDPYVKLELVSGSELEDAQKRKTTTVKNNGFNPSWEKENVKFDFTVKFPDFAMLEVKVLDNGSEEILGMSYIPIKHLQSGYRVIEIYDMTGQNITNSKGTLLFCEIAISNENEHSEGDIVRTVSPSNDISILDLKESDLLLQKSKNDSSKRKLQKSVKCVICSDRKCIANNPIQK
ncbi:unnamed protein product [Oikopleura dioica]|uniref:Phosphoinositide phospholipase C n=1 Tax=Oikopleura dioica TaxID=34765 RepID=E4YAS8_OIKDI|nr:unnamed protein product [Oikopleura dioica]